MRALWWIGLAWVVFGLACEFGGIFYFTWQREGVKVATRVIVLLFGTVVFCGYVGWLP